MRARALGFVVERSNLIIDEIDCFGSLSPRKSPHAIEGMKRRLADLDSGWKTPFSEFEELLARNP